jgi:hypothetical protein
VLCAVSLAAAAVAWWQYLPLSLRIAFADEQTEIFDAMRSQALAGDPTHAAHCLQYVVTYYPPGTKQAQSSPLNRIVERSRARATADIIAHLRATTHTDLGAAPEPWIRQYAKQQ